MRTNIFYLIVLTAVFTLSATNSAAKDEVYRWVDENGVVHFENRAPRQADAEKITIRANQDSDIQPAMEASPKDTNDELDSEVSYAQQRRDERARTRQEASEKEKMTTATCEQSRKVVAQLEPVTRVLVEQEDGTVIRMDDNDRVERLREEKAYIAENCNK
jgi:hypothetical protein